MTSSPEGTRQRPYTQQMVIIHRVFRRESRLLAELIEATASGDTARSGVLAGHFRDYALFLHTHHEGEDELLWPKLLPRVDLEADVVLRMEAQHERINETLARAEAALPDWESSAGPAERMELAAALNEHRAVLVEHLDDEEAELLPLAARYLSVPEWNALGVHGRQHTPLSKGLVFLGLILEDALPDERAMQLAQLPGPLRPLWSRVLEPRLSRRMRRIRQDHVPA